MSIAGRVVDRLPHLVTAHGQDGPLVLPELEACRVPFQVAELDDPSREDFRVLDEIFVPEFEHRGGQGSAPVFHEGVLFIPNL